MEQLWLNLGGVGAFLAITTYVVQASIRGTWSSKPQVELLLAGKQEIIVLKDAQIALLLQEKEKLETTVSTQSEQISGLTGSLGAMEHFFREVQVQRVPSLGGHDIESERPQDATS